MSKPTGPTQQIIFTAVPNGIFQTKSGDYALRVYVLVSPRLTAPKKVIDHATGGVPLSTFPDFVNWPATPISWQLQLGSGAGSQLLPASVVASASNPPSQTAWSTIFNPTDFVLPFVPESYSTAAKQVVQSYPVGQTYQNLKSAYQGVAGGYPTEYPPASQIIGGGAGGGGTNGQALSVSMGTWTCPSVMYDYSSDPTTTISGPIEPYATVALQNYLANANPPDPSLSNLGAELFITGEYTNGLNLQFLFQAASDESYPDLYNDTLAWYVWANQPGYMQCAYNLILTPPPTVAAMQALAAKLFHQPLLTISQINTLRGGDTSAPPPTSPPPAAPGTTVPPGSLKPTVLDFHQVIAGVADHQGLMRSLGLVVELTVPLPTGETTLPSSWTSVQAVPTWTPQLGSASSDVLPIAMMDANGWPQSKDPYAAGGYLQLDNTNLFTPMEIDADGASLRFADFATNLALLILNDPSTTLSTPTPIPAIRQSGLSVTLNGRASYLAGIFADTDAFNATAAKGKAPVLRAEHVEKGYRVDVFDTTTNQWYQLCARSAPDAYKYSGAHGQSYQPKGAKGYVLGTADSGQLTVPVPKGDEGFVALAVTSSPLEGATGSTGGPPDIFVHETMFRWTGWSLVGSRPGQTLSVDPALLPTSQGENAPPSIGFPVQIDYVATPGTLPVLRFGRSYQLRARVADIAGGGQPFTPTSTPPNTASPAVTYGRFEPAPPPVLLMAAPVTQGERLERLVIRSNYDIPDDPPGTTTPAITPCVRHVVPPSIAQLLAEQHGMFDTDAGVDPNAFATFAKAANATIDGVASNDATPDPNLTGPSSGEVQAVYYPTGGPLTVPYLPDVLSLQAALAGVPSPSGPTIVPLSFEGTSAWPSCQALRLQIVGEGSQPPVPPSASNGEMLTVSLPKAAVVEISSGAVLSADQLPEMGIWQWFLQTEPTPTPAQVTTLTTAATNGQLWMLTPTRTITLVHAVQQPLVVPQFSSTFTAPPRTPGVTAVSLSDPEFTLDQASTQKVDVLALWDEWVDTGTNSSPDSPNLASAAVGEVQVPAPPASWSGSITLTQDFPDTRARTVYYSAVATTRFAEYFTEEVTTSFTSSSVPITLNAGGVMPGSVVVTGGGTTYQQGTDYLEDDESGTISLSAGSGISVGESLLVRYVPQPVSRSSLEGAPSGELGVERIIPSSARPDAPTVLYALPTFSFEGPSSVGPETLQSIRRGGGIRVYLDRPWWSSGGGEMLGVILADPAASPSEAPFSTLVTQWGADPFSLGASFETSPFGNYPPLSAFPLASGISSTFNGLTLDEDPDPSYQVAAHEVQFDSVRGLWFSDIQIEAPHDDFPFVRLALARFQPSSITGCELSKVIVLDHLQTAPQRTTVADLTNAATISLSVSGTIGANQAVSVTMYGQVQQQVSGYVDDLAWQPVAGSIPMPLSQQPGTPGSGPTTWTGTLPRPTAAGTYRVLVWEQQSWSTSSSTITDRIVHLDAIPL